MNRSILVAFGILTVLACVGSWSTSLRVHDVGLTLIVLGILFGIYAPLPVYWHQKGDTIRRDATLLIPYAFALIIFIPVPFLIGARLGLPLQDWRFARIDHALGVNVGAIVEWTHRHGLAYANGHIYNSLFLYLAAALFIPALMCKREGRRFLVANVLAFAVGIPCCAFLPAIGPWYSEHFPAGRSQILVQQQVLALRAAAPYSFSVLGDAAGIVAFPSFHVIWAILAASSLWGFRKLRPLLALWSLLIIISTMTTGFHYFVDVLAGIAVAAGALASAERLLRRQEAVKAAVESHLQSIV
jgi:hypothetical protein